MFDDELAALNEHIILMVYTAATIDLDNACMVFCTPREVMQAIIQVPLSKLMLAAASSRVLMHPAMLPADTWLKFKDMSNVALSTVSVLANNKNSNSG